MTRRISPFRPLGVLTALALGAGLAVLPSPSAVAAAPGTQLRLCERADSEGDVVLEAGLDNTTFEILLDCDVTVDLAGQRVTVRNVVLGPDADVRVTDSVGGGTLVARADLVPDAASRHSFRLRLRGVGT